jgi:hypothetical protein
LIRLEGLEIRRAVPRGALFRADAETCRRSRKRWASSPLLIEPAMTPSMRKFDTVALRALTVQWSGCLLGF